MKWVAIQGSWTKINAEVTTAVRDAVREIIENGDGIISGGAPGVDMIALDQALLSNPTADRIRIYIPSLLSIYISYYQSQANTGIISNTEVAALSKQLNILQKTNKYALIEGTAPSLTTSAFLNSIDTIMSMADSLTAFHVNHSDATGHAIAQAKHTDIPVKIFTYTIL